MAATALHLSFVALFVLSNVGRVHSLVTQSFYTASGPKECAIHLEPGQDDTAYLICTDIYDDDEDDVLDESIADILARKGRFINFSKLSEINRETGRITTGMGFGVTAGPFGSFTYGSGMSISPRMGM